MIAPKMRIAITDELKNAIRDKRGRLPTTAIAEKYNVSRTFVVAVANDIGLMNNSTNREENKERARKWRERKRLEIKEDNGNTISYSKPTLLPFHMIRSKLCQIIVYNDRNDLVRVKEAATYLLTLIDKEDEK